MVAGTAHAYGDDGAFSTVVALVLAPIAVTATARVGRRLAGRGFGLAAAAMYVLLPALGRIYVFADYRSTFDHRALPDLLGLRATPAFALGVLLAVVLAFTPRALAAALGAIAIIVSLIVWGAHDLVGVKNGLHETAWSITMLEWLVVAGVLGAARRSAWLAVGLGGWLVATALHAAHQGYANAAFWQSLAAAMPAIAVLLSAIGLLVPRLRPAPAPSHAP